MDHPNATIIPTLKYKNCQAAIDWLGAAFRFKPHMVVPGDDGTIRHAQLILGKAMIMVGTADDSEFGKMVKPPDETRGLNTQSPYIVVENIESIYHTAKSAGADMVIDLKEEGYGGKFFACKDPEGHLWNFGDYDPWK